MRQELIEASKAFDNPQAFLLGAQWMENYLNPLPVSNIVINSNDCTVSFEGKKLLLPKKEFELLKYLYTHSGRIITRDELLEKVWENEFIGDRTVDVHIRKLRSKISIAPIRTIKSFGYIWDRP